MVSLHDTHSLIDLTTVGVVVALVDDAVLGVEDAVLVEAVVVVVVVAGFVAVVAVVAGVAVVPEDVVLPVAVVAVAAPLDVATSVVDVAVEALELVVDAVATDDCEVLPPEQAASDMMDKLKLITTATRLTIKISLLLIIRSAGAYKSRGVRLQEQLVFLTARYVLRGFDSNGHMSHPNDARPTSVET